MAVINKTPGQTLQAWADVATGTSTIGTVLNCNTTLSAAVFIHLGRGTGSAFTSGWPNVRIEVSGKSSGNDDWIPVASFQMALGASIGNTTLNGAVSAGATNCVLASSANLTTAGLLIFLGDTSTSNYELVRSTGLSGSTMNFEQACTYNHASGALVTAQAEMYTAQIDMSSYYRLRSVIDNVNSGQGIKAEVLVTTGDSIA